MVGCDPSARGKLMRRRESSRSSAAWARRGRQARRHSNQKNASTFFAARAPLRHREATMRRRDVLALAGSLATGASLTLPAPAIAQGTRQLKMVTDWPDDMPGLQTSARRFAQTVGQATGGRIKIEVFPAGVLVRAFETFDAVEAGVADLYHSADSYFERKSRAFNFFVGPTFGLTANELFAWIRYG